MRLLLSGALLLAVFGCVDPDKSPSHNAAGALWAWAEGEALGDNNPWDGELPLIDPVDPSVPEPQPGPTPFPDDGPEVFRSPTSVTAEETQRLIDVIDRLTLRIEVLEKRIKDLEDVILEEVSGDQEESSTSGSPSDWPADTDEEPVGESDEEPRGIPAEIEWTTHAAARASPKPVWLRFYGSRCGPCRRQEETVFRDPRVISATKGWACVKIEDGGALFNYYGLKVYPSEVFVTESSALVVANSGGLTAADYVTYLNQEGEVP